MVKNEKEVTCEQQLPGRNFKPGSTTLFEIAESHGKKLGLPQTIPGDAIVEDKNKDILAKAIPADRIEQVLRQRGKEKTSKVTRGMVLIHKPTGKKVTIVEKDVDTTSDGTIRHRIIVVGSNRKFLVPETSLEIRSNGNLK